jgi:hypothetical protein
LTAALLIILAGVFLRRRRAARYGSESSRSSVYSNSQSGKEPMAISRTNEKLFPYGNGTDSGLHLHRLATPESEIVTVAGPQYSYIPQSTFWCSDLIAKEVRVYSKSFEWVFVISFRWYFIYWYIQYSNTIIIMFQWLLSRRLARYLSPVKLPWHLVRRCLYQNCVRWTNRWPQIRLWPTSFNSKAPVGELRSSATKRRRLIELNTNAVLKIILHESPSHSPTWIPSTLSRSINHLNKSKRNHHSVYLPRRRSHYRKKNTLNKYHILCPNRILKVNVRKDLWEVPFQPAEWDHSYLPFLSTIQYSPHKQQSHHPRQPEA